jgi:hypothetical protein
VRATVWDNGLFTHLAVKLAETWETVNYGMPYVNAFPKSNATLPGDGIDSLTRILDLETHVDESDLIIFPDVMFGPLQQMLVKMGKQVWGPGKGEELELNRWKAKRLFKSWGMPVAESHLIVGIDTLRRFLQQRESQGPWWIKTSRYRGDFETFCSKNYDDVKPRVDQLEYELGMKGEIYPFIVEKNIKTIMEIGYDGHTIDGQFPGDDDMALFGVERKDLGYVGVAKRYGDMPPAVRWVNERLSSYLAENKYRGFFSSEIRVTEEFQFPDGSPEKFEDCPVIWDEGMKVPGTDMYAFLTDPCCRMASPPGEAYVEWADNWPEIIEQGAKGIFVPVNPVAKYAVEIMLHSSFADRSWQPVRFPDDITQWVKLRNCCKINGVYCCVPQSVGLPEIGAVIGLHNDLNEACRLALDRGANVEGYFIEARSEAIQKVITEIHNAQESGLEFTDDGLPSAEKLEELQPTE